MSSKHSSSPLKKRHVSRTPFEDHIRSLLVLGRLSERHIALLTTPEALREFRFCFTHKSADPINNLETYEWYGDVVLNEFICFYIREKHPEITNVGWLSKIKGKLASGRVLGRLGMDRGFEEFAIYGEDIAYLRDHPELDEKIEYIKMYEDIFEAFFGCLTLQMRKAGFHHGTAIQICHNILEEIYSTYEISFKYEDVFDAVSRLKELYENRARNLRWPNQMVYAFTKIEDPKLPLWSVKVYGWPGVRGVAGYNNKVLLAEVTSVNKDEAKQKGAKEALKVLFEKYGIQDLRPTSKTVNR